MSLSSWLWGASQVDEAIDKATSELLPAGTEDIALNLEISDQIRSKAVPQKDAMRALKRRLNHKNPNVQLLALSLTDTCIKNGGDHFLQEVASREFMDNLVSILKMPALNREVKEAILRYTQNWSYAFEGKSSLSYVEQVYKTLKTEGFAFPPRDVTVASSAMVDTQTAPEWIDSDVCLRCRTAFTFTNRKHHCRNCGQVFDQQCSSKSLPLPHFGIQQEVRVCDGCHVKLTKNKTSKEEGVHHPHHRSFSTRHRSARDFADEELQRAIQLSLEEVGAASASGHHGRPGYVPHPEPSVYNKWEVSEPPIIDRKTRPTTTSAEEEDDPDLKAAIEASLREANAPKASAPIPVETPRAEHQSQSYAFPQTQPHSYHATSSIAPPAQPKYDLQPLESDVILTFSQTVHDIEERGGRDLARYPAVNDLYDKANGLRPKLALSLDDADRKERTLTEMHNKLSQAVKLYDKLLSEQLNRPSWRAAPQQDTRYRSDPSQVPLPAESSHWSGQQQQQSTPVQAQYAPQYSQQPPVSQTPTPYNVARQNSYGSAIPQQQQYYQTAPVPQQVASPPPVSNQSPPIQYAYHQQQPQQTPPTMTPHTIQPPPMAMGVAGPAGTGYPSIASPPPLPSQGQRPPQQNRPSVSRQNTLTLAQPQSYAPAPTTVPAPPPTVPHTPYIPSQPQPQSQSAQMPVHPQQQPPTAPQLPQFPSVPTTAVPQVQAYQTSTYAAAFEQPDRKEAMLIDL